MKIIDKWMKWPLAGKVVSILVILAIIGGVAGNGGNFSEQSADQAPQDQIEAVEPSQDEPAEPPQQEEAQEPTGTLAVHFIDVGQGDSEFLELPTGETMLIDAGEESEAQAVVSYVESLGHSSIDYVVATHPHSDHIGGMPAVFSAFEVGEVWAPAATHDTQTFEAFLDAVEAEGLSINTATAGKQIASGNGMEIDVLSPKDGASFSDLNDWSAIVGLTFGEIDFLFTGDAGTDVISAAGAGDIDVLKVGHHGSDTSTTASLVSSLSPEYAVISCGAGNSYGHPHQSTLDALVSATVYRTDADGTVIATSDGSSVTWQTGATPPKAQPQEPEQAVVDQGTTDQSAGITVYITNSGEKYHLDGCSSLRKSKIPTTLEDAKAQGYEPCKRCNPPS